MFNRSEVLLIILFLKLFISHLIYLFVSKNNVS